MKVILLTLLLTLFSKNSSAGVLHDIEIIAKTKKELETKKELLKVLNKYDLSSYIFTRKVIIKEKVIPHSHPVLTLHTRYIRNTDRLLSLFLHEQIHWFLVKNNDNVKLAIKELREVYKEVPVGYPLGARNEHSSYLHLIVNWLEYHADLKLLGKEKASKIIQSPHVYKWIYNKVFIDYKKIEEIILKNDLLIK